MWNVASVIDNLKKPNIFNAISSLIIQPYNTHIFLGNGLLQRVTHLNESHTNESHNSDFLSSKYIL